MNESKIGSIKTGKELGYKNQKAKYIYQPCLDCGALRWVRLLDLKTGQPKLSYLRCRSCSRRSQMTGLFGDKHNGWKGGRYRKGKYIVRWVAQDDFFYSMADSRGKVLEHRLIMAQTLGRCLHSWEIVHHKNGIKDDNRIENLQLVTDDRHKQITVLEQKIRHLEEKITEQDKQIRFLQWRINNLTKDELVRDI